MLTTFLATAVEIESGSARDHALSSGSSRQPGLRAGERLLAEKPYVFDQDALNAELADLDVETAPSDLASFTDEDVAGLFYAWLNRHRRLPFDVLTQEVGRRVCAERTRRGQDAAYRGPAQQAAA